MSKKRQLFLDRMARLEQEYLAAGSAVRLLQEKLKEDPSWGKKDGWQKKDADDLARNLEGTYLVRLFAVFEEGLRDAWEIFFQKGTLPKMEHLMDSIAIRQLIPDDWLMEAHEIRDFRNSIVHDGEKKQLFSLKQAKQRLAKYFSRLPLDW